MTSTKLTLRHLCAHALERSLFAPSSLPLALERLGYVQADPIRAPARAQDLTLRPRVIDYRAGDLEARYPELPVEEDYFVNYGFLFRPWQGLMHPRPPRRPWTAQETRRARQLLAFVEARGSVHPREVDAHFAHGKVVNYWGGSSNATTQLLDRMHYRGLLRVARRTAGIRIYAVRAQAPRPRSPAEARARLDQLIDVLIATYAPMPALSFNALIGRLRYAAPQWQGELKPAIARAKQRCAHARVDADTWYWPAGEDPTAAAPPDERVHLLGPFDPVVWDRRRFELFWGFPYRFEAYTPLAKRRFGYYALPLLFRGQAIGWANLTLEHGELRHQLGYLSGQAPRDRLFKRELEAELARMQHFLTPHVA
jgi:uncharacterized protein YcaQ